VTLIARAAVAYWRWNERVWLQLRRFDNALMALAVGGAIAAWIVGVSIGNMPLMWAPAILGAIYWGAVALDERRS
jgi:hypothetical protein